MLYIVIWFNLSSAELKLAVKLFTLTCNFQSLICSVNAGPITRGVVGRGRRDAGETVRERVHHFTKIRLKNSSLFHFMV